VHETAGRGRRGRLVVAGVACLLAILLIQLALSVRGASQTWDEGDHIFAGYMSWKRADFGLNPEHPPLVKLLATAPLLSLPLRVPEIQRRNFKIEAFLDGKDFVAWNDPDRLLFRVRMAALPLTLLLALLVFLAAREMFGTGAAFLALALVVFEPNLLAHGAWVTTDAGVSCFLFAAVYAFYRYVKVPSLGRLALVGAAAGLALATKHTGILIFPMLALAALPEVARDRKTAWREAARLAAALVLVTVLAVAVLWAFYGFRYRARPAGFEMNPPLARFAEALRPAEARAILSLARWRVLPESYLFGLADVRRVEDGSPSYVFGKVYPKGVWFYFPAAFAIKSTLAFLALLLIAAGAIARRRLRAWREILFLTVPPLFYLAVAMASGLNIGVRHILPLYVFFTVLAAGASGALIAGNRRWKYAVAALLVCHVVSSARSFPVYLAYSNELWGGPSSTYKYLTDSNTDWAQQLKSAGQYLARRGVRNCWFAYFAQGVAATSPYGIPCQPLPTPSSMWVNDPTDAPPSIDGPVLISAGTLSGYETGPGALNPYDQFQRLKPTAVIDHGIFVFDGHFEIPLAAALPRVREGTRLLAARDGAGALAAAQSAAAMCPDCVQAQSLLGAVLTALKRPDEARAAYQKALALAEKLEPAYRERWAPRLQARLAAL
jgi:4-amino-4-deoxy-L-arabinose transferase-like glycosyltransferase